MAGKARDLLAVVLEKHEDALLSAWLSEQLRMASRTGTIRETDLRQQCAEFLHRLRDALGAAGARSLEDPAWQPVKETLSEISRSRSTQGFTPVETATFVLSFKRPLLTRLRQEAGERADLLADELWNATELLDRLGLFTTEVHQATREEIIRRQQEEVLELSTPVVKLWEGVVALPMIGTLDSNRTQVVMETLLQKIVETGSEVAIIDITGVPTVDTLVAQHLLKTVAAARLMGAECIISGIRPQIAQTIVHLGIQLGDVTTKSNLADALKEALRRVGTELHANPGRGPA